MNRNKLYVVNFPYSTTEDELQATFSPYGSLREVKIIADRESRRSRGFAFVTFDSLEAAEAATPCSGLQASSISGGLIGT